MTSQLDPKTIDRHIRHAHQIRSEAVAEMLGKLFRALSRLGGGGMAPQAPRC